MKRLYTRIYMHVLGALLIVGLSTSAVFSLGQRGAFLREVTERLSRHLSTQLGERFFDAETRSSVLSALHRDFDLDLTVRDTAGNVLTAAGATLPGLTKGELDTIRSGCDLFQNKPSVAAAPIRDGRSGKIVGILQMSLPHRFRAAGWGGLWRPFLAVALVLIFVAMASAPLAHRISRPVELLTEASRRLGAGELSYRIPLPSFDERCDTRQRHGHWRRRRRARRGHLDELQVLMRAWNDMAERIERLLRGQRELLANISHELRSPLTRVRVALELLPRDGEGEARLRDVEADLGDLERLIEDVLMTSRLEAGGLPTRPTMVPVRPLLSQVVERARQNPATASQHIEIAPGAELTLQADAALLKRVLLNLIENAAKYGAAPIVLAAERREGTIEISVTDAGEGIMTDERDRVLEPFYRGDRARTPSPQGGAPQGFGLGLTLARRVAEAHGGTISVSAATTEAGKERGCRVTLSLPQSTDPST